MGIESHKAYIEFNSQKKCCITTVYRQKSFDLENEDVIDLIKLKKIKINESVFNNPPCSFFATCSELSDQNHPSYIIIEIWAIIDPSNTPEIWGQLDLYDGSAEVFQGNIWTG